MMLKSIKAQWGRKNQSFMRSIGVEFLLEAYRRWRLIGYTDCGSRLINNKALKMYTSLENEMKHLVKEATKT